MGNKPVIIDKELKEKIVKTLKRMRDNGISGSGSTINGKRYSLSPVTGELLVNGRVVFTEKK
jgi:hypothetical protein